jgi:hypothetical protein
MKHKIIILSGCNENEVFRIVYFSLAEKIIVISYSYEDNNESEFGDVSTFISKTLDVKISDISYLEGSNIWDADYWHSSLV